MRAFFILGRHPELSLAEIFARFPEASYVDSTHDCAIFDWVDDRLLADTYPKLGGSIFAGEILGRTRDASELALRSVDHIQSHHSVGKIRYTLSSYPADPGQFSLALSIKKQLRSQLSDFPVRNANHADGRNPGAVLLQRERIIDGGYAFVRLRMHSGDQFFWRIRHAQDVDAYSERDMGKQRDMNVGMLPPKLAQILLSLSGSHTCVYDPFCGLGTVPIEAARSGISPIFASDISAKMVRATRENLARFSENGIDARIFTLDARDVATRTDIAPDTPIVTEGWLGPIFSAATIAPSAVERADSELARLYLRFFGWLSSRRWSARIVLCLPVWHIGRRVVSATRSLAAIRRAGFVALPLLPDAFGAPSSLVYRRPGQTVGREVCVFVRI